MQSHRVMKNSRSFSHEIHATYFHPSSHFSPHTTISGIMYGKQRVLEIIFLLWFYASRQKVKLSLAKAKSNHTKTLHERNVLVNIFLFIFFFLFVSDMRKTHHVRPVDGNEDVSNNVFFALPINIFFTFPCFFFFIEQETNDVDGLNLNKDTKTLAWVEFHRVKHLSINV